MKPETPDQDRFARDIAASIYSSLNLLTIKKSVRILCELEETVLEDFVKKFSGVVIFLLNILDPERSNQLLSRLTDSSLVYLTEEELRLHLIREIAFVNDDEAIMSLSLFLDILDRTDNPELFPATGQVLGALYHSEHTLRKHHFAYLDTLRGERRQRMIREMLRRNIHVALGVMIFSSRAVSFDVMDEVALARPTILADIPEALFRARFMQSHALYLEGELFQYLPPSVREQIQLIRGIQDQYRDELARVADLSARDPRAFRKEIINIIYGVLKKIDPTLKSPFLSELEQRGHLTREDIVLLNEFDRS